MGKSSIVIFLILVFTFFSVAVVSAATYKQWEPIDINHAIRINGAASSNVLANITVKGPDNIVIASGLMSYNVSTTNHNYTVPPGRTGELGEYSYDISASGDGLNATSSFTFDVTPSGEKGLLGFYFLVIILSYGVMGLGLYKQDITISLLGTMALFFVGIYMMFFGIDVFKNRFTDGFSIITLGLAFYVSARMAREYLDV